MMIKQRSSSLILLLGLYLLASIPIYSSKIKASSLGYTAIDATLAFQNAIYSGADSVIIDFVGNGKWNLGPSIFFNLKNLKIFFEPGVELIAKAGYLEANSDCLIALKFCINVKLIGSNNLCRMPKAEYTSGEKRHALALIDSENIEVSNFTFADSGGDGIFITGYRALKPYCENIIIRNVICDNNRRQGISVITVQNLLVEHCEFKNTKGTLPEAGLDLEPDLATERLVNVEFRKCSFTNNDGRGIQLSLLNLRSTSQPVSIVFNDCYVAQNGQKTVEPYYDKCEISAVSAEDDLGKGTVTFNRILVENSQWSAVISAKAANSFVINFNDSVFRNISQKNESTNNPIWIETTRFSPAPTKAFGGINFNNQVILYNTNLPFLEAYGANINDSLINISGNISVANPAMNIAPKYNSLSKKASVNFTQNIIPALPTSTITASNEMNPFSEKNCISSSFSYTRTGPNNTLPLAITYGLSGTANNYSDYLFDPKFIIIPATIGLATNTLIAIDDLLSEPDETINISTNTSPNYNTTNGNFAKLLSNGACNIALSVKYISIEVRQKDEENIIEFEARADTKENICQLERSSNGSIFEKIDQKTIGFETQNQFIDKYPKQGLNYYRIKSNDNGTIIYSKIVAINFKIKKPMVFPNPVADVLSLENIVENTGFEILNFRGEKILFEKKNRKNIEVSSLKSGIYFIRVFSKNKDLGFEKFIKN
jgi:hypothetical protein